MGHVKHYGLYSERDRKSSKGLEQRDYTLNRITGLLDCREDQLKVIAVIQVSRGGGGKLLNLRHVLKVKPTGFVNGLHVGCKRKREVKNNS